MKDLHDDFDKEVTTMLGLPVRVKMANDHTAYIMAKVDGLWHDVAYASLSHEIVPNERSFPRIKAQLCGGKGGLV